MQLLSPRVIRHLQKHHQQYVFADELIVKIQRFRECFQWNTLPSPTAKVIAAWNDLPNVIMDNLSTTVKTELVFPRAPPPTPTGLAFDTSSGLSLNSNHDDDDWLLVDDTTPATSDAVFQTLDCTTNEDDSVSRSGYPDQSSDQQVNEEDPLQSTDSNSSDESHSSSGGGSPMPVGFDNMVNQWLLDYRARGTNAFIESLIAFGVISVGTALQASRVARALVRKVAKISYMEGRNLESNIRFSALAAFKKSWELNDTSSTQGYTTLPTPYGINIASLMGSLFEERISTVRDIHLCLSLLLEGEKRFDRLCAMHALLVQANDKLCKNRNLPALMHFRDGIACVDEESGEYLWGATPHSKGILIDILALIERWTVSQAIKREQSRVSSVTGHRIIRKSAVGPRLRNGPMAF